MPTSLAKKISLFPLFSNFKKPELAEIAQNCFIKTLFKDEQLFVLGEKRDVFFIVVEGEIGIIRKLGEASQMVEIVNPGEYIAEHALFNPKELHSHTAIAISKEAVVIGLPGKLFPKLSQKKQVNKKLEKETELIHVIRLYIPFLKKTFLKNLRLANGLHHTNGFDLLF